MAKPDPGDIRSLLAQAQKMQEQVQQTQDELAEQTFEATAGGGAVKAVAKGDGTVVAIEFDPSVLDPSDPELVGDLVVAAVNQALEAARQASMAAMGKASGLDLGAIGLDDLLG